MDSELKLRQLCNTESDFYLRPFAPNVNWKESKIFIVGTNPATPLEKKRFDNNLDNYWTSLTKDNDKFKQEYETKHQKGESKTTRRVRQLKQQLAPLNVLILNAIIYPSPRIKEIPEIQRQRDIGEQCFKELLKICQPKVILFHGKEANDLCLRHFKIDNRFFNFETNSHGYPKIKEQIAFDVNKNIRLFSCPHLSGLGVPKGYKVSEMNSELDSFTKIAKDILKLE